jgi:hypothetical protein
MEPVPTPGSTQPATGAQTAVPAVTEPVYPMRPRFRKKPKPSVRIRGMFLGVSISAVVFLLSLTVGLLMAYVQVDSNWMTAFCSLVWAITFVALLGWSLGHRGGSGAARHQVRTA